MYFTNGLCVLFLAILSCNVANAKLEPSKYTVTFTYNEDTNWCLGGIIGDNYVLSSAECFAEVNGLVMNFSSIKAVVGSIESEVEAVILPEFPSDNDRAIYDFAIIKLKQSLDLEKNNLVALQFPQLNSTSEELLQNAVGFVSKEDHNEVRQVKIVDSENCPSDEDMSFFADSQLCVELPDADDSCLDEVGTPLVDDRDLLIGIYLDCYDESPHEIFAKVSFFTELINKAVAGQSGPYKVHNYS